MFIDQLLTIENWKDNSSAIMEQLLGGRVSTAETEMIRRIMQKTVCYSAKTWKRTVVKYDALSIHQEISSREKPIYILDVGCGDASVLAELKDIYQGAIECYGISVMDHPHSSKVNYLICPAEIMPVEWNEFFDIVIAHQSYRYMLNPNDVLKECVRVLKPGGVFAAYIGLDESAKRLFYNQKLPSELNKIAQRIWSQNKERFNIHFQQLLLSLSSAFVANISFDEMRLPHKIYLVKDGDEKIIIYTKKA